MIKLTNLQKNYQELCAVDNLSLEIPENVIYGIIGKSGAGKSTLVRLMSLLERPDRGEIWFGNDRVDNLRGKDLFERRYKLGMIFQNFNLFASRNVFKNIAYPMEILGKPKNEIKNRVEELLELVDLSDKIDSYISKLSGGQKQRVAIARALANSPEILFCDEATSALDPQTTLSILQLIKDIKKRINLTVIMITHQMEVVKEVCDYVSVIDEGKIVECGTVKEIFSFPKTDITREFLCATKPFENEELIEKEFSEKDNYRLHFLEDTAQQPILSYLIRTFDVDVNIISGTIYNVNNAPLGELVVAFHGSPEGIESAKNWLTEHNIKVEKIK